MRRHKGPVSRAVCELPGALALRRILTRYNLRILDLADIAQVHKTAAGRWLYGMRPSRIAADRLRDAFPREITRAVLLSWGYAA